MKPPIERLSKAPSDAGWTRCCECGGSFGLAVACDGAPTALHSWPYCAAYDAIETDLEAVAFSRRCRAALGDLEARSS